MKEQIKLKSQEEMKVENFKGRRFTSRRDSFKKESSSNGEMERWEEKRDLVCFKCKKLGHIKYDCSLYKSEAKRRKKKTIMATQSESKESPEEENDKEVQVLLPLAIFVEEEDTLVVHVP